MATQNNPVIEPEIKHAEDCPCSICNPPIEKPKIPFLKRRILNEPTSEITTTETEPEVKHEQTEPKPQTAIPFRRLLPLAELIAGVLNTSPYSVKVREIQKSLITNFGTEFNILLNRAEEQLTPIVGEKISGWIIKNRNQEIKFLQLFCIIP